MLAIVRVLAQGPAARSHCANAGGSTAVGGGVPNGGSPLPASERSACREPSRRAAPSAVLDLVLAIRIRWRSPQAAT